MTGAVVGVAGLCTLAYLTTEGGNDWVRVLVEREVTQRVLQEGSLTIGGLRTDFVTYATLTDVRLKDAAGNDAIVAPHLAIRTAPTHPILGIVANLIPGIKSFANDYQLDHVDIDGLDVRILTDAAGSTNLGRMFSSGSTDTEPWSGIGFDLILSDVAVHGGKVSQRSPESELRLLGLEVLGGVSVQGPLVSASPLALSVVVDQPFQVPVVGAGLISWDGETAEVGKLELDLPNTRAILDGKVTKLSSGGDVDVTVDLDRLSLATLQTFTGPIGLQGVIEGPIAVRGPMHALTADAHVKGRDGTRGAIDLGLTIDAKKTEIPWSATLKLGGLHVEDLVSSVPPELMLDGTLVASGSGTTWPNGIAAKGRFDGGRQLVPGNVQIEELHTQLALENGVVSFDQTDLGTAFARIAGGGSLDLVKGDLAVDGTGTVILDGLTALEIPDLYGSGPVSLHLWGNVLAKDAPLDATGVATVSSFAYTRDVRFQQVSARYHWRMRDGDQRVDADVVARGGDAYGAAVGSVAIPDLRADLPKNKEKHVSGTADARALAYPNAFVADRASGPFAYDEVPGEPKLVTARLTLGPHALGLDSLGKIPGTGGTLDVRMVDQDVEVIADLVDGDRESLHTVARVNLTRIEGTLTDLRYSPVARQQWVARDVQRFRIVDGALVDGHFDLAAEAFGRIQFDGDVGVTGALDGRLVTHDLNLEAFAELFPEMMGGTAGVLDLAIDLHGTADHPDIAGQLAGRGLWLPGLSRWLDVAGPFTIDRGGLNFREMAIGAADQPLAVMTGHIPMVFDFADPKLDPNGQIDLDAVITPGPLARLQWLTETDLGLPEGARISATIKLKGKLEDPDLDLYAVGESPLSRLRSASRIETVIHRKARDIELGGTISEGLVARATVDGSGHTRIGDVIAAQLGSGPPVDSGDYGLYLDDLDLKVALHDTPMQSLLYAAGRTERMGGRVTGLAHIVGDPYRPAITGNMDWVDAGIGGLRVPLVHAELAPVPHQGWTLEGYALFDDPAAPPPVDPAVATVDPAVAVDPDALPTGPKLVIAGKVPLSLDFTREQADWVVGDLDLAVTSDRVPLEVLRALWSAISATEGTIDVNGHIGGTPFAPHPDLTLLVADGTLEFDRYGVRCDDFQFSARADSSVAELVKLHCRTEALTRGIEVGRGSSTIDAVGRAPLVDWTPVRVGGQVKFDNAQLLARRKQRARISGDLAISGEWVDGVNVRGSVAVVDAHYEYDPTQFAIAQYEVDRQLRIHRTTLVEEPQEEAPTTIVPSAADLLDVDVGIDLGRSTRILASLPFVEDFGQIAADLSRMDVDVRLGSQDLRMRYVRGAPILQGDVEVLDGSTKILRSRLDTTGHVTFLGDPYSPQLDLSARMEVTDGSVQVTIKGSPDRPRIDFYSEEFPEQTDQLTILLTGESPERLTSGSGASSALTGLLLNKALGTVGGDSISIAPDGTLTIGVPSLIPKVKTLVAIDPSPSTGQNRYSVEAEVNLIPHAVLQGVWGDEHSWADIYWELRF